MKKDRKQLSESQREFLIWIMENHKDVSFQENMKSIVKRGWYRLEQVNGLTIIRNDYIKEYINQKDLVTLERGNGIRVN